MKKNVASQAIGAQMTTATDGSDFTGTVTVYVTGDNGTQTLGTVGSGVCTHEGNGYHSYAPAQAETNYDHIAFTFIGSGAVSATVQLYTEFPQTGDSFARLGAPAGASVSADVAAIKTDTAAILVDTGTTLDGAIATIDTNVDAILVDTGTTLDGAITAIKAVTDLLPDAGALSSLATAAALATVDSNVDAILVDTGTTLDAAIGVIDTNVDAILADTADMQPKLGTPAGADMSADIAAVKAETALIVADTNELQTDDVPGLIAALNDISVGDILTTQMTEAYAADGVAPTLAQSLMLIQQMLGDFAIAGTTLTVKKLDGSTTAATFTLDDATNPTSITRAT